MLIVLLALFVPSAQAGAAVPPGGPRLAYFASHPYPNAGSEVATVGPDGGGALRLSGGSSFRAVQPLRVTRPSWSADGGLLAFAGAGAGQPTVFTVQADGSYLRPVRAARRILFDGSPVLSPGGRSVALFRLDVVSGHFERPGTPPRPAKEDEPLKVRTAIWALNTEGGGLRPLTPWTLNRPLSPSSYSPDGNALAATEWRWPGGPRAVSIDLRSGRSALLARNAKEPIYAADGRVAAVRDHLEVGGPPLYEESITSSDLLVGAGPGKPLAKVLTIRHGFAWPSWDPSGQRIAFTTLNRTQPLGLPEINSVMEVNADGSCLTTLPSLERGHFGGVAWQPGPDRGAGRIAC